MIPLDRGLFDLIAAERQQGAAHVAVEYDRELGHPVRIAIDHHATYVDDEVIYDVRDLDVP